jgi:hypothetical protein
MIENAKHKSFLRTNKKISGQAQYRLSKCLKIPNHEQSKKLIYKFVYVQKCKHSFTCNIKEALQILPSVPPDPLEEFIKYSETLSDLCPL